MLKTVVLLHIFVSFVKKKSIKIQDSMMNQKFKRKKNPSKYKRTAQRVHIQTITITQRKDITESLSE